MTLPMFVISEEGVVDFWHASKVLQISFEETE